MAGRTGIRTVNLKGKIMEAGSRIINQIFNPGRELTIPFFQRGYVWEEDNWQRFLDSMVEISENEKPYFFGSAILKTQRKTSDKIVGDCRLVIDGQQRLTTICLFFKALYKIQEQSHMFERSFYNLENTIILKHNHMDGPIFNAITTGSLTAELEKEYKNNNVLRAYKFFINDRNKEIIKSIKPHVLLNNIQFVGIDLEEREDEQQIFDTINSLGVRLTTAELLKNHLYPTARHEESYQKTWKKYFEGDEETRDFWDRDITAGRSKRNNLDVLLQSYFIILKKNSDKFKLEHLFQEYKKHMLDNNINDLSESKNKFIADLMKYADLYKNHIDSALLDEDSEIEVKTPVQRLTVAIFALDITTLIPYVLYVLKEVDDKAEQDNIFRFLETYIARCFICKVTTKNYNNLFASFINNDIKTLASLQEILNRDNDSRMPTDAEVKSEFNRRRNAHYIPKCILYLLELSIRDSNKQNTKLLSIGNYDLEHIMPQKWQKHWPLPVSEKSKEELEEERYNKVASIGNMTILKGGLNKALHNVAWTDKKTGKKNDGLIVNGAGLATFSQYIDLPEWNEEQINKRADFLLEKALEVWGL